MLVEEPLKAGTIIKRTKNDDARLGFEEFKVLKAYSHHVLCEGRTGIRTCITNAKLMTLGIVRQRSRYEDKEFIGDNDNHYGGHHNNVKGNIAK